MTFQEYCDTAYNLVVSRQHIGLATLQYELNISRRRLSEVLDYLEEKYDIVESYCTFHDGVCLLTKEDKVKSERADEQRRWGFSREELK